MLAVLELQLVCVQEIQESLGHCRILSWKFKFFSLSGGGMYVENDGLWFLKGITSNTKQNVKAVTPTCNDASYAIFTNVHKYIRKIEFDVKFNL